MLVDNVFLKKAGCERFNDLEILSVMIKSDDNFFCHFCEIHINLSLIWIFNWPAVINASRHIRQNLVLIRFLQMRLNYETTHPCCLCCDFCKSLQIKMASLLLLCNVIYSTLFSNSPVFVYSRACRYQKLYAIVWYL